MKNEIINKLEEGIRENGPSILTGFGVVGLISTVGLAIKATHDYDKEEHKTDKEKIKAIVKHYWPVTIVGVGSIVSIIGSNKLNVKRNIALAGAYKLSEDRLKEYKEKLFGAKEKSNDRNAKNTMVIFGEDEIACLDPMSGRYFKSDIRQISEAMSKVNNMLLQGEHPDLNDFYGFLGLDEIELYLNMTWNSNDGPVELIFDTELTDKCKPVLTIDFDIRPRNNIF